MNWKRGFGTALMFFGIYLIIINGTITGNVIGIGKDNLLATFGFFIFFVGILFIFSGASLEERIETSHGIKVYARKGVLGNNYFIHDAHRIFTSHGDISLYDFKEAFDLIKNDKELSGMAREVYGNELMEIAKGEDGSKAFIATKFLKVLYGEENIPEIEVRYEQKEKKEEGYNIIYNVDPKLSLERQKISGRLKNAVDHMEDVLVKGGDPGIRSHSMGKSLRRIYEARSEVHGGPRIYYTKDPSDRTITILGYSTKNTANEVERRLTTLYGK